MPIRHQSSIPSLIIAAHVPKYTDFMKVKAGELVTVGKEDDDYPGWVWCADAHGISNWVPKTLLKPTGDSGHAELIEDYDATELPVKVGDIVTVFSEQSGWVWCQTMQGKSGWIPKECVAT